MFKIITKHRTVLVSNLQVRDLGPPKAPQLTVCGAIKADAQRDQHQRTCFWLIMSYHSVKQNSSCGQLQAWRIRNMMMKYTSTNVAVTLSSKTILFIYYSFIPNEINFIIQPDSIL